MKKVFDRLAHAIRRRAIVSAALIVLCVGAAVWAHAKGGSYGPYGVIGYNYTDRHISNFTVDGFGGGASHAHEAGGGGGIVCCLAIPKRAKTLHIEVELEWTKEQYEKNSPHETFEANIPVPVLENKHDGFIEFHFLPQQRIEAKWVDFPAMPNPPIPNPR